MAPLTHFYTHMCTCTRRAPTSKCLVIYCSTSYPFFISVMVHTFSPLPACLSFFFSLFARRSFLPIFGAGAEFCIVLPFPWILSFHHWLAFPFELNQINLRPRQRYSLCVRWRWKAVRGNGTCVCFMMAVIGAHVLFPALFSCYHSHRRGSTVLLAL